MILANDIFEECEELAGRLTAIRVNFPDTEVRVKHAIYQLRELLKSPKEETIYRVVDELQDLKKYLNDIRKLDPPSLDKPFRPCIELIERLLGPTEVLH